MTGRDEAVHSLLAHHGVKGMKWGVRKNRTYTTLSKEDRKAAKTQIQKLTERHIDSKYGQGFFDRSISEAQYKKLSSKDTVIRKGHTVQRVTTRGKETYDGPVFVSTNKSDQNLYRAVMPVVNGGLLTYGGSKSYKNHYEVQFKALENLKSPSEKARVDAFAELMDQKAIRLGSGKVVNGREYLARQGYRKESKTLTTQQLGLKFYNNFTEGQGAKDPINTAYFESLRKKGYNSVVDDNDRGHLSKTPLIILNPNGSLKKMKVTPLSADDITRAQKNLKAG